MTTTRREAEHSSEALYSTESDHFVPTAKAGGPWSSDHQHGGPPCGLLAQLCEQTLADTDPLGQAADASVWRPARFAADLFRAIPMTALRGGTRIVRHGRRLRVVEAWLSASGAASGESEKVVCRASTTFLRTSATVGSARATETEILGESQPPPPPRWGSEPESMIPRAHAHRFPPGFHFEVEVDWRSWEGRPGVWVRMPTPILSTTTSSGFVRACALSDFANAVTGRWRSATGGDTFGYINCDNHVVFEREPSGEAVFLTGERFCATDGIGTSRVALFDEAGRCGTVQQTSLRQGSRQPIARTTNR